MVQLESGGLRRQRAKPDRWRWKPRSKKLLWILVCIAALFALIIVAATSCGGGSQTASTTTATTAALASTESGTNATGATTTLAAMVTSSTLAALKRTAPGTAGKATAGQTYSDGTYLVGTDIPSGLYEGTVSTGEGYWAIASDPSGGNIITSANPTGQFYLQVKTGQYLILAGITIAKAKLTKPATLPSTDISDGTYLVGTDIAPGTYQGSVNGDSGYWEIASDANGENVISTGYPTDQFSLQVQTGQFLTLTNVTISQQTPTTLSPGGT